MKSLVFLALLCLCAAGCQEHKARQIPAHFYEESTGTSDLVWDGANWVQGERHGLEMGLDEKGHRYMRHPLVSSMIETEPTPTPECNKGGSGITITDVVMKYTMSRNFNGCGQELSRHCWDDETGERIDFSICAKYFKLDPKGPRP